MDGMELWMLDDDAAWWAKLRRADRHREKLAGLVAAFKANDPYTLKPEMTDRPDEVAYRLRVWREAPADISTVIGDVLHNLRSALDALAFEVAVQSVNRTLTKTEEGATEFPICESPDTYDAFFGGGADPSKSQRLRGRMYSDRARNAMRHAQPFHWAAMGNAPVAEKEQRYREEFEWSQVRRLRHLSNIDKHRRLPAIGVGWPKLLYWGSDVGDDTRLRGGHMPPTDDTILCYLVGPNAKQITLHFEFALVLTDDPIHQPDAGKPYEPQDCMALLEGFSQSVDSKIRQVLSEYARLRANNLSD
jgi:hypothetical protein